MDFRRAMLAAVCATTALASSVPVIAVAQSDSDAGVPSEDAGPGDAGPSEDAGTAGDASAPVGPSRTPPRLLDAPAIDLPEGAEPLPPGSGVELILTIAADGSVTDAAIGTPLREDIDALVLAAAPGMHFAPATRDGVAVPARIRFRYALAVEEEEEEEEEPASASGEGEGEGAAEGEGEGEGEEAAEGEAEEEEAEPEAELADEEVATYSASGTADRPEPGAATRMTFRGAELSTVPGTFGDPVRALQYMPGISRLPFGLPFLVVRGAQLQNTGYFIDGVPVPNLWHFLFGPTVINTAFVTQQDFYPGNFPVRFGRFSQSVVSLETGIDYDAPLHIEASVDALRAEARAFIPFDNGRGVVAIAARRSYYELVLGAISAASGQNFPSVSYDDYQARLQYRFSSHFAASLFVFGSDDSLDNSGAVGSGTTSADTNIGLNYQFQRAILRLDWNVDTTTVRFTGSVGRDATTFFTRQAGATQQNLSLQNVINVLRLDMSTTITPWLRANYGVDAMGTLFNINLTAPTPTGLGEYERPAFDPQSIALSSAAAVGSPGIYGEALLNFDPVEISLGVRVEVLRYGVRTDVAPDPRLVGRLHFTPDVTLIAATGLFTQEPSAFQTVGVGGNPQLGAQRSLQNSLGLEMNLPLQIFARLTGWFSYMWDIARMHQTLVQGPGNSTQRVFYQSDQQGRSYGLEALIRRPLADGFYGSIAYTLARSERVNPGGDWFVYGFDQTHSLNIVASYEFDGWRFGLAFQLITGRPTLSVCGATFNADSADYDATYCDRGERLPIFHQLNARIDRDFNIANTIRGSVYIDVLNVYNAQTPQGVVYQYDYARSAPIPGLPILGTLGIRAYYE